MLSEVLIRPSEVELEDCGQIRISQGKTHSIASLGNLSAHDARHTFCDGAEGEEISKFSCIPVYFCNIIIFSQTGTDMSSHCFKIV